MAEKNLVEGWFTKMYKELERAVNAALAKQPGRVEYDQLRKHLSKRGREWERENPRAWEQAKRALERRYGYKLD